MARETTFKIKGNSYKVKIENIGQWQDIESLKIELSRGMYGRMMSSNTYDSQFALDMIDIEAIFTVTCPKLKSSYKGIDSLRDLDFEDALELRQAYIDQVLPFIQDIRKLMKPEIKEDDHSDE